MSSRRAAIRRERKQHAKIEKNKSSTGGMLRAAEQGKLDGRTIAFCVAANLLYDLHGFRIQRIYKFLEKCNKEAARFDGPGLQFVLRVYADKIIEKLNDLLLMEHPADMLEHIYCNQRDEFFISSLALMFTVLNGEYGMAFNQKQTGRLDVMLEYCVNEYLKLQLDPDGHDAAWYVRQTREKTGIII